MDRAQQFDAHLANLRKWRGRREKDLTLSFLVDHVKKEVVKPHRQVGQFAALWQELVPAELAERTRLASFARGILTVHVADSSTLYEIDRVLRGGVERAMQQRSSTTLRSVKLKIAPVAASHVDHPSRQDRQ